MSVGKKAKKKCFKHPKRFDSHKVKYRENKLEKKLYFEGIVSHQISGRPSKLAKIERVMGFP